MSGNKIREEYFIIGYGLSKFTGKVKGKNEIIRHMGYKSRDAFLNDLVERGALQKVSSLKNVQDGFDAVFPDNPKRGWCDESHKKQFGEIKNRIDIVLGSYGMEQYAILIRDLCNYLADETTIEKEKKTCLESIVASVSTGTPIATGSDEPKCDEKESTVVETVDEKTKHLLAQWLLIKIGQLVGCETFIAKNDSSKEYNGESIADLCVSDIPRVGMEEKVYKRAKLIDVIWIQGHRVVRAFEVECTTSIYSGILRMSDLMYSMPYSHIKCCVVAPKERIEKVKEEITRPTFSNDHISEKFQYTSIEELQSCYDKIKDFKPGDVTLSIVNPYLHLAKS